MSPAETAIPLSDPNGRDVVYALVLGAINAYRAPLRLLRFHGVPDVTVVEGLRSARDPNAPMHRFGAASLAPDLCLFHFHDGVGRRFFSVRGPGFRRRFVDMWQEEGSKRWKIHASGQPHAIEDRAAFPDLSAMIEDLFPGLHRAVDRRDVAEGWAFGLRGRPVTTPPPASPATRGTRR